MILEHNAYSPVHDTQKLYELAQNLIHGISDRYLIGRAQLAQHIVQAMDISDKITRGNIKTKQKRNIKMESLDF